MAFQKPCQRCLARDVPSDASPSLVLLAAVAEDLATAMRRIRQLAYAILDGTLISIDRVADQQPYYSDKHKRHGLNVQVIADAAGWLVWASPALPGSAHDLTAARIHGIIDTLTSADVMTFAAKGYQGARGSVRTPFKRRRFRPKLSGRQKAVNRTHARIGARGGRVIATLKTWRILTSCAAARAATAIVQAILVLHHVEANRYAG
ncbi:hypothetical protein HDA35_004403 [Micromonospora purpureochromogenes]|uniref:DDE Tnp4 domain-containing protein n=1 Tax=Micromonospora purpureochromogenes TaxID=47872 RepID=A0ABX2RTC5_9ACTN|nr:hypothetical protein [Micromonospora purpureochromogenes]